MKIDLYGVLGIPRDTPTDKVKGAFRKAAKNAHPDGGGSVERFALVKLAANTLGDDDRRERYDRTGEIEEDKPDGLESQALQLAFQTVEKVIEAIYGGNGNPETVDILAHARANLQQTLNQGDQAITAMVLKAARLRKVALRFTARKGKPNRLTPMWNAMIAGMERSVEKAQAERKPVERAIEILGDHEYLFEPPAMVVMPTGIQWAQMNNAHQFQQGF